MMFLGYIRQQKNKTKSIVYYPNLGGDFSWGKNDGQQDYI